MSLNIFVGDEIFFKDNAIKECLNSINDNIDLYTIDIDEQRKIDSYLMDMYSHLMSFDFENKYKAGLIRTTSLSKTTSCVEYFSNIDLQHCLLIIDFNANSMLGNESIIESSMTSLKNVQSYINELSSYIK